MRLRSAYDREILRLAVPALGALAAEPLYILVDTAIVGHLGRSQLAALGAAATVLSVLAMFNFLQYGTTAQVARASGAGEDRVARRLGAQALWLSLAIGVALAVTVAALAGPIVDLVGVEEQTADYAATYLRIVSIGIPSFFLALGGQGFLRGVSDLTSPLVVIVLANVLNLVLEVLFVYGFDWGIEGSAWGTAIAQTCMGIAFVWLIARRVGRDDLAPVLGLARRLLSVGKFIFVRTAALICAFLLAGVVVARLGDAELGAYQISFQLWIFLALVLDAIAIAGQILVGRELGGGRPERAYDASVRMIALSVATGVVFARRAHGALRRPAADLHRRRRGARPVRAALADLRAHAAAQRSGLRSGRNPDRRERRAVHRRVDGGRLPRLRCGARGRRRRRLRRARRVGRAPAPHRRPAGDHGRALPPPPLARHGLGMITR